MTDTKTPPDELISTRIAERYTILTRLGAGGMGVAYRAWDALTESPVVIKIPKRSFFEDPTFAERFAREIRLLQQLSHPNIVPVFDLGEHEGRPFIVMRFLPGGSLSNRRLRDSQGKAKPNPPGMLRLWLPEVASALDYVHANGIVHRDVKPGNIFFDAFWKPFLGDFGVAKIVEDKGDVENEHSLTATNVGIGTQEYMGPEQFTPKPALDGRTDQYALAVTVYELLSGSKPFTGQTSHLIVEVMTKPVPRLEQKCPGLPRSLVDAVHRGLAKKPRERFASCREFADALLQDVPSLNAETGIARLLCPVCSNLLKLPETAAGKTGKCSRCQTPLQIASDLGALWLVDEVAKAQAAAASSDGLDTDLLKAFDTVSGTTRISKAAKEAMALPPRTFLLGGLAVLGLAIAGVFIQLSGPSETHSPVSAPAHLVETPPPPPANDPVPANDPAPADDPPPPPTPPETMATVDPEPAPTVSNQAVDSLTRPANVDRADQRRDVDDEVPQLVDIKPPPPQPTPAGPTFSDRRPADAIVWEATGSAYKVMPDRIPWSFARQRCRAMGGHLATIQSAEEQEFILSVIASSGIAVDDQGEGDWRRDQLWIGGTGIQTPAGTTWRWEDGSPWEYEAWIPDQPPPSGPQFMAICPHAGGRWTVESHRSLPSAGFICEWSQRPPKVVQGSRGSATAASDSTDTAVSSASTPSPTSNPPPVEPAIPADVILSRETVANSVGMSLKWVPAGTFSMGSKDGQPDENPVRSISIPRPFLIGITEVTNNQWKTVMGSVPGISNGEDEPVTLVSWDQAVEFCKKLSALPSERDAGRTTRLPTEQEWEYVCRAGTRTRYSFGDDADRLGDHAWFLGNSEWRLHPVATKKPNAWGLHDLHGNVMEWCQDGYMPYGQSRTNGATRVTRGGGWLLEAEFCRAAVRGAASPSSRLPHLGFRVAVDVAEGAAASSTTVP